MSWKQRAVLCVGTLVGLFLVGVGYFNELFKPPNWWLVALGVVVLVLTFLLACFVMVDREPWQLRRAWRAK